MSKKNNNFPFWILILIFAVISILLFTIGGILLAKGIEFKNNAVKTQAVISEISNYTNYDREDGDTHSVYVDYEFEGQYYEHIRLNIYTSSMYEGKTIDILLDPEDPSNISMGIGGATIGGIICLGIGFIFFVVAIIVIVVAKIYKKNNVSMEQLKYTGMLITGKVDQIWDDNVCVNGRHPHRIYCSYEDAGTLSRYKFKSERIWDDSVYNIGVGVPINIYVNPGDFSKYYVDVTSVMSNGYKMVDFT